MANANQVIVNGETILDLRSDTVTPETLQKGYTAHDKSGTKITGTLEASSSGGAKETWVLMEEADIQYEDVRGTHPISFTDGAGAHYDSMTFTGYDENSVALKYDDTLVCTQTLDTMEVMWEDQYARKLILDTPPTGVLKLWLDSNGEKQDFNNIAVQLSKDAGTIISNGSTSIYPDAPYDAMQQVYVTVNVASGGGGAGETTQLQVTVVSGYIDAPIYCLWQTSNGWTGTGNFDTSTNFTLPNVIVGGYVIFTHDPSAQTYFFVYSSEGLESFSVAAMDSEWDTPDAALVIKVTAPSPKVKLVLRS